MTTTLKANPSNKFKNSVFDKQGKKYHNTYLNRFISLNCAADLIGLRMFPNAKEITESFGAVEAARNYLPYDFRDSSINLVVVGDGTVPRTAALFAHLTKWKCFSVDPEMKRVEWPIDRLRCFGSKIEDRNFSFNTQCLIVSVHSHAKLSVCLEQIKAPQIHLINMPCCVSPDLDKRPDIVYTDENIQTEKNSVEIYSNLEDCSNVTL